MKHMKFTLTAVLGLFIVGGLSAQITLDTSTASPGAGSVLVDAAGDGVASWQAASSGSQGPQGKQGPAGDAGPQGPAGAAGADGGGGGSTLNDDLWGFWPMYEGSGLTARDISGNGHDANLGPGAASTAVAWRSLSGTAVANCLDLDAGVASTAPVGSFADVNGSHFGGSVSVTAFIRVASYPTPQNYSRSQIVVKLNSIQFYVDPSGYLKTWVNGGPTNSSTGQLDLDQWHYVAMTFDHAADVDNIYINGVLDSSHTQTGSINVNGRVAIGAATDGYYHFEGYIDQLRIYNRVLTADEIVHLWNPAE
ncbi:MAG: LamG domain-containing protein [Lentisphaeria bacterium]|nr:LamG domain-containing protein [Lentisphaeria bacterium]